VTENRFPMDRNLVLNNQLFSSPRAPVGGNPITKPNTNSCSIGIGERHVASDEQKHRNQEPAVVPVSSNQHSRPSLTMLSQDSHE
jgi:hypothetical protein